MPTCLHWAGQFWHCPSHYYGSVASCCSVLVQIRGPLWGSLWWAMSPPSPFPGWWALEDGHSLPPPHTQNLSPLWCEGLCKPGSWQLWGCWAWSLCECTLLPQPKPESLYLISISVQSKASFRVWVSLQLLFSSAVIGKSLWGCLSHKL